MILFRDGRKYMQNLRKPLKPAPINKIYGVEWTNEEIQSKFVHNYFLATYPGQKDPCVVLIDHGPMNGGNGTVGVQICSILGHHIAPGVKSQEKTFFVAYKD